MLLRAAILVAVCGGAAAADVVSLGASADAFLSAAHPANNYGGAGVMAVAAPGLANGEFQSVIRFDTSPAKGAFDLEFGAGQWVIQSVTLQLTSMQAGNPIFNSTAPGQFTVSWIHDDAWDEGTGTPNMPDPNGVNFSDLPTLLASGEEDIATFAFDGNTGITIVRTLPTSQTFLANLLAGGQVSLRFRAADAAIAMLVNSRSFMTPENRPVFAITGVASNVCYANCDNSTSPPILNANDFQCFLNEFAAGNSAANCDGSTSAPVLNANDFQCFLNKFAAGCP
jgi:hypothetical protein